MIEIKNWAAAGSMLTPNSVSTKPAAADIASVWILGWLRNAFSILPQARALITTGPYRHIRHPLYAAEGIASVGLMLQFVQPLAAAITLAGFALQILRMYYEEQVLPDTFPEYGSYKKRTFRRTYRRARANLSAEEVYERL